MRYLFVQYVELVMRLTRVQTFSMQANLTQDSCDHRINPSVYFTSTSDGMNPMHQLSSDIVSSSHWQTAVHHVLVNGYPASLKPSSSSARTTIRSVHSPIFEILVSEL